MTNAQVMDMFRRFNAGGQMGLSPNEQTAILQTIEAGRRFGYGNMIAWLATAWATELRDKSGLSEETAIIATLGRHPFPLPAAIKKATQP